MNKKAIIDYVMNTPHNTNPAILKQMLDANSGGAGCEIEVISDETIDFICGRISGWQEDENIITDEDNSVLLFTNY